MSRRGTPVTFVPVRSPRGFLAAVLAVLAVVALGLAALAAGPPTADVHDVAYYARQLSGWPVAVAPVALGVAAWIVACAAEAVVGTRWAVAVLVGATVLAGPPGVERWARGVWERGSHPTPVALAGTTWRDWWGGECGYFSAVELTFDTDSTAVGTELPIYVGAPLVTPVLAVGRLDGPEARPFRAALRDDTLWVEPREAWEHEWPVRVPVSALRRMAH